MKSMMKSLLAIVLILSGPGLQAQTQNKEQIAVITIDSKVQGTDPLVVGNLVRTELEKLDMYNVKDRYDIIQFMEDNKISMTSCFGKSCLSEVGTMLKVDKMFTGTIEQMPKSLVFTYRIIDVKSATQEKTHVHEFLNIPEELQNMIKLSVAEMFGQPFDKNLMNKLTKKYELDNSNNNPTVQRLKLDGPRLGCTSFTGDLYTRMTGPKDAGGYDVFPVMFQFGYQFEKQYLNEGKAQALFEFIPMVTGLDQGYFIPSITLLHGLRSNVNGWEFAIGPTFYVVKMAKGYYDESNNWHLERNWNSYDSVYRPNPYPIVERVDSRGFVRVRSSFVLAVGRTFKSGKLNIPVNLFVVPGKNGWRYGISFGFNAKNL